MDSVATEEVSQRADIVHAEAARVPLDEVQCGGKWNSVKHNLYNLCSISLIAFIGCLLESDAL
jgi:hypothetical protein